MFLSYRVPRRVLYITIFSRSPFAAAATKDPADSGRFDNLPVTNKTQKTNFNIDKLLIIIFSRFHYASIKIMIYFNERFNVVFRILRIQ